MKNRHITAWTTALAAAALAPFAASHNTVGSWSTNQIFVSAAATSFPAGNSYRAALGTIESRFFYEQPSAAWFTMQYDDTSIAMGNGQNEVWFSADPANSPAVTFWWFEGSEIVEADMVFYNGLSWTTSTNKTSNTAYGGAFRPFETTAMHEFGHAAGLGHEEGEYNIMGKDWNHVSCNGSTYRSYVGEDAANGLVSLYGLYSGYLEDVGVTLFKYSSPCGAYSAHTKSEMYDAFGVVLPNDFHDGQRRYEVQPGQSVRVEFTFEDIGKSAQTTSLGYYISTDNYISSSDRLIATSGISMARDDVWTRYDTVTIPADLDVGQTYYLGVRVDDDGTLIEATEDNNAAYHAIEVVCGVQASTTSFNAGSNPDSLTASLFHPGSVYSLEVDLTTTGHDFALPIGFDTPFNIQLAGGQRLLCIDGGGNGELLGLAQLPGPIAEYFSIVSNQPVLCGFYFSIQAIHFGGVTPFALSNAQDVRIGI